jgi:hypothetical protein
MENQEDLKRRIKDGRISQLKELADEIGCSLNGAKKREDMRKRLWEFSFPGTPFPTSTQPMLFSEEHAPAKTHGSDARKLVCLPLIVDEFLFMWEGGFICHPAVMSEMARETGVELEARAYHDSQELPWDIVAQIPGEVRLYVSDAPEKLTVDWAASFRLLVRIEVDSLESKEELIRRIQQTHQRLDAELQIQVGNVSSTDLSKVQPNLKWSVLESKGFIRMKRIDSMIGAIAVSSYVERLMLVQRKLNSSIRDLGWLGSAIFQTEIWKKRLMQESDNANVEGLRGFAENANNYLNFKYEWQFDIRDTLSAWRLGEDDFPALWSRFALELPEEIRASIERDMRRGLIRDVMINYANNLTPWLIYIALLWKHKGIRNRSSNASQSLLHTLIDFAADGIVSGQNAVTIAAYHGWHVGYQLCTASPVDWAGVYGGASNWWSLKLSSNALAAISSALIQDCELSHKNRSQECVPLSGGFSLVFHSNGVARIEDTDVTELYRICQTESTGRKKFHALLPGLLGGLKSLPGRPREGSAFLGQNELEIFIRDVAAEMESDDEHGSKRLLVKVLLAGWNSTKHEQDG